MNARKYMTDEQLEEDVHYHRAEEDELRRRAHSEWHPTDTLRAANTAKLRAEASEQELRKREQEALLKIKWVC